MYTHQNTPIKRKVGVGDLGGFIYAILFVVLFPSLSIFFFIFFAFIISTIPTYSQKTEAIFFAYISISIVSDFVAITAQKYKIIMHITDLNCCIRIEIRIFYSCKSHAHQI